ncbi:MAG TPA: hypothetical protein VG755_03545 [Nannocystaceae bacterium]|nr:hypothetical protein [Nannocystaceae bacterium]
MITAAALASVLLALAPSGPSGANDDASRSTPSVALELGRLEPIDPGVRAELAAVIHAAISEILRNREVAPETIHIAIAWRDQSDVDYAVRIRIDAHGGVREQTASTGPDATSDGLAGVVAAALARVLDERPRAVRPEPAGPRPQPPIVVTPAPAPAMKKDRKLGRLGWAGVGLAIAGTATLGGGIGLLALDRTVDPFDATRLRDWRPAGGSLVAIGGLALVAGMTMALVDIRPSRQLALAPFAPKRGLGLALRIRL